MTESDFDKGMMADESDPQKLAERSEDPQGSFLDVYRSLDSKFLPEDEYIVHKSVENGIIPETVRYGVMTLGKSKVIRGVVKSRGGNCFYFNWFVGKDLKIAKATTPEKEWEAKRLLKSCHLGCDLRKSDAPPIDPGTSVEEDVEESKGAVGFVPSTAMAAVPEDRYIDSQERLISEQHPGSTQSQDPPPDDAQGKNWHEPLTRAQDGLTPLASNNGQAHWTAVDLLKAYGQHLQRTAPRLHAPVPVLEERFMKEALGASDDAIRKGLRLTPRQKLDFNNWRTDRINQKINTMKSWLERH